MPFVAKIDYTQTKNATLEIKRGVKNVARLVRRQINPGES